MRYLGHDRLAVPQKHSIEVYRLPAAGEKGEEAMLLTSLPLRDLFGIAGSPSCGVLVAWSTHDRGVRVYGGLGVRLLHVLPHQDLVMSAVVYESTTAAREGEKEATKGDF